MKKFLDNLALRHLVEGMAFSHSTWIDKARNRLEGALGEFTKIKYAELIGFDFDWEPEVETLLEKVEELFDPAKVKLKGRFDLDKAFKEAAAEAAAAQDQVTAARNDFIGRYLNRGQVKALLGKMRGQRFRSEDLLAEMLITHAPNLAKRLSK